MRQRKPGGTGAWKFFLFIYVIAAVVIGHALITRQEEKEEDQPPTSTINTYISKGGVVIFSASYCPYCAKVKQEFTAAAISFSDVEANASPSH